MPFKKWTKASYQTYLTTPHWKQFQKLIYRKYHTCYIGFRCWGKLNIHHLSYQNLGNESEADVVVLGECHHKPFHAWAKARKMKPDFVALQAYWIHVRV